MIQLELMMPRESPLTIPRGTVSVRHEGMILPPKQMQPKDLQVPNRSLLQLITTEMKEI